jgi:oligopeptide transport system substrate-binding protein
MKSIRFLFLAGIAVTVAAAAGCASSTEGPIAISAIGEVPAPVNPNLAPLGPPSALLLEATAQGLVRFEAGAEIEPALAQSWIVSDDGLRYTFRIRRALWTDGRRVTAEQVAGRLRAAVSRASRNPLKPVLGAIDNVVAMTDQVLEISLRGPRPNLLQLLAQPEMAIMIGDRGTGPYRREAAGPNLLRLTIPQEGEESDQDSLMARLPPLLLRGEAASLAVARFAGEGSDLVTGGTLADLAFARAARTPANRLVIDPVAGLLGLSFATHDGPLGDAAVRAALSMAIDRDGLAAAFPGAGLRTRLTLASPIADELPRPAGPDWATDPLPMRRGTAAATIRALPGPLTLRVAVPDSPGYRLLFAHLRRDWRLIGVEARRVGEREAADLRLIDRVAPASLAPWFLRQFACDASRVCDPAADQALQAARSAPTTAERHARIADADRLLATLVPFIPIASPVRWSLVSPRLTGFQPNPFGRHPLATLVAEER